MTRDTDAADSLGEGGSPEADRQLAENFGMTVRQVREFDPQTLDVTRACKFLGLPLKRFDLLATQPDARARWVESVARQKKDLIGTFPEAGKEMREMLEAIRKFALRKCLKPDGPALVGGGGRWADQSNRPRRGRSGLLVGGGALAVVLLAGGVVAVLMSPRGGPGTQATAPTGGAAVPLGREATEAVPARGKGEDRSGAEEGKAGRPPVEVGKGHVPPGVEVLLDVDFAKTGGDFRLSDQHHIRTVHTDGELRYIGKKAGNWFDWLHPAFHRNKANVLEDFVFEADVRMPEPARGSLVCRFGMKGDFYQALSLRQDGHVAVWNSDQRPEWTKPENIRPITEVNTVRLEVARGTVRLQVNGRQVLEKPAARYEPSNLVMWLYPETVPFEVRFRRIKLWKMPASAPPSPGRNDPATRPGMVGGER